jgi:PAS domain S-box-containing protein
MIKTSISKKATRLIVISISLMAICLLVFGFFTVWRMRFDTVGTKHKQMAEMIAQFIAHDLDLEVDQMQGYLTSAWWHDAVKEDNARYAGWEPAVTTEYMARMDEQWIPAAKDAPLVQELLSTRMSDRLKKLAGHDSKIAEMFLTDQYGALVAASDKTSDFYQADEAWWQRAYNNGKGDVFVGAMEMDASSGKLGIALAVPMRDEAGQVMGIFKIVLDGAEFFKALSQYKFAKTGHTALLNRMGAVLYHPGLKPLGGSGVTGVELDALLSSRHGFSILPGCAGAKALITVAKVKSSYLKTNGIDWVVVLSQEEGEVFLPVYKIFLGGIIFALLLASFIIFFMNKRIKDIFIVPLESIKKGIEHFSAGELEHRIDVETADEIEVLTTSLNEMSAHLKQTMTSRDSLVQEIAQRQQAEVDLQKVEKRFMDIFYASKDAGFLLREGQFVDCNAAAVRMLGCSRREEVLTAGPAKFSPPTQPDGKSSLDKSKEMIRLAVERGAHRFKWVHRRASGEDFMAEVSLALMIIQGKEFIYVVVVDIAQQEKDAQHIYEMQFELKRKTDELELALQDSFRSREILTSMLEDNNENRDELEKNLKELKSSQSMLINSEKLASLGRLVSEIAHEVNNPLMIISGNAQLSLMNEALDAEDKTSLEVIMKECQRAKNVIRRVLRFAKPSKGDVKEIEIGECLEGIVGIVEQQFMLSHNVQIKKEYLQNKIHLPVDEQQIQEVFMNLLNNAKEMMLQGGIITITTSMEGDMVRIDFKDNGPGMSEETMQKIMEPFFTTKETGTGIGLAICYGIVKAHNGEMRFESELGKGTTATVLLPLGGGKA